MNRLRFSVRPSLAVLAFGLASQVLATEINVQGFDEPMLSAVQKLHSRALESSTTGDAIAASVAWGELGMLMQAHNLHAQAITAYSNASNAAKDPRWSYLRGIAQGELGNATAAIVDFRAALEYEPNQAVIWYRLGRELLRIGEHGQAVVALTQSTAIDEKLAVAQMALGDALVLQREFELARSAFSKAFELAPESGQVIYRLAQVERELGNHTTARNWLTQRTNQHAPAIHDPLLVMVAQYSLNPTFFVSAARRAWERGDTAAALNTYTRAIELAPGDLSYRLGLVRLLKSMGRLSTAEEYLGEIEEMGAQSREFWQLRSQVAIEREQFPDALQYVDEAIRLQTSEELVRIKAVILRRLERSE